VQSCALKLPLELLSVEIQCLGKLENLDHINPSFTALYLRDICLLPTNFFS
jgi:hypothetical protein